MKSLIVERFKITPAHLFFWLFAITTDWLIILFTCIAALKLHRLEFYILAILIIGNRQHAIGILGHDAAHRCVSRHRKLNDWLGNLFCFWPFFSSIEAYRRFHFEHHRFTGTPQDPEVDYKKRFHHDWILPATKKQFCFLILRDLSGLSFRELLKANSYLKPLSIRDGVGPTILVFTLIASLFISGHGEAFVLWQIALFSSMWAFFRMRMWIEHWGFQYTHRVTLSLWQRLLFAPHNTWYHWEHHKYPTISYRDLPKVRDLDHSRGVTPFSTLLKVYRHLIAA